MKLRRLHCPNINNLKETNIQHLITITVLGFFNFNSAVLQLFKFQLLLVSNWHKTSSSIRLKKHWQNKFLKQWVSFIFLAVSQQSNGQKIKIKQSSNLECKLVLIKEREGEEENDFYSDGVDVAFGAESHEQSHWFPPLLFLHFHSTKYKSPRRQSFSTTAQTINYTRREHGPYQGTVLTLLL